jgi:lauroyl/myristoyl acyltransferase
MKRVETDAAYPSRLSYWAGRLAAPPASSVLKGLADIYRILDKETTARLRYNFSLAFPDRGKGEREELIRKHWRAKFRSDLVRRRLLTMPREELRRFCLTRVEVEGEQNFRLACESERPVVFFTPHYGDFAVACLRVTLDVGRHKTVSVFYDPPEVNPTTSIYQGLIERLGCDCKILFNDKMAALKGLRALKRGNVLCMMPDVYEYNPGLMYVPFFGRLAVAMGGTAFFALKSDALLIPVYCYGRGRSRFALKYGSPIETCRTGDFARDLYLTTAAIFASIQEQLTTLPEHWVYWSSLHERFGFAAGVELPRDTASWMARFSDLGRGLADENSSLAGFLTSFEERLRRGVAGLSK